MFLVGHYGSGKSHFLAYLAKKLRVGELGQSAPEPIPISLLNYASELSLEQIITSTVRGSQADSDRRTSWNAVHARYPKGLLLLLDELSEFLRSKPTAQSFNEDIRFLQFLGEWTCDHRLWVLCAMQEQIEHTGAIEGDLYRKIKDRFPVRFLLTPTHVKDFIGHGLLIKGPGFENALEDWFSDLKTTFAVAIDFDDMKQTYPLHPTVIEILEEIRDQFSQTRGIVDFTVKELLGDPSQERQGFLDQPFGELLTADRIVDHFADLLELQPQFQDLSQKVLPYYRKNMATLFPQETRQRVAWRLLNLLILVHLSPRRQVLTVKEATWWLLQRVTRLDPHRNEEALRILLDKMADDGAFVARRGSGYLFNLADDSRANLERILEKTVKELKGQGESLFERLIPLLDEATFSPFTFKPGTWQRVNFAWHLHSRSIGVFLGGGQVTGREGEIGVQIGLPWGAPPSGSAAIVPKSIEITDDIVELAALVQLKERPIAEAIQKRIDQMLFARRALFFQKIQMSYGQANLCYIDGYTEPLRIPDTNKTFRDWVGSCFEKVLKRHYPQFERYAPSFGPLPVQAFQEWMEFSTTHEIIDEIAPERIRIIREGYLCPMGLVQRKGRGYRSTLLNRHDLVNFVYQFLPRQPSPSVIYKSLSEPIYGLIPEQIHCLLLFLYLEGEIDISKEGRSYRECYNELPLPIQYDKLSLGRGLSSEQLERLERICDALGVEHPERWGVINQRRMAEKLRELGRERSAPLHRLLIRTEELGILVLHAEIERYLCYWRTLDKPGDEISSLQQFLYETQSSGEFVTLHQKLESLPERFESVWRESERLKHLLSQPTVAQCEPISEALSDLEPVPSLGDPDAVQHWIDRAKRLYQSYAEFYQESHRRFWHEISQRPIWTSSIPKLAYSANVSLSVKVGAWATLRDEAKQARCAGLTSSDFQPACRCGFRADEAPVLEILKRWEKVADEIQKELHGFFQQESVKAVVARWLDEDPPADRSDWESVRAYLDGKSDYPELSDFKLLDQRLSGLATFQSIDSAKLLLFVEGKTWDKAVLIREFSTWLEAFQPRVRFVGERTHITGLEDILVWAARESLTTGRSLPALNREAQRLLDERIEPDWVSDPGLAKLEGLGFSNTSIDNVTRWAFENRLPNASILHCESEMCRMLSWIRRFPRFSDVREWGEALRCAYRQQERCLRLFRVEWLELIDKLANWEAGSLPTLMDILGRETDAQWLCLDAMGILVSEEVKKALETSLRSWHLVTESFAVVDSPTSTDQFYRCLLELRAGKAINKVNAIDTLIHSESQYGDILQKLGGLVGAALRKKNQEFDTTLPILVFGDHGFRLSRDGRSFYHGGPSTLERIVPVLKWMPSSRRVPNDST